MNRRKTHFGGMGMYNKRNKNNALARHSMAPHGVLQNNKNLMNTRRSSIMMQSMKLSKDPRPLKDKQWIEKQIEFLIEFLCSHGYDSSMLSPKELNPPSTKNFQYICCFLFQQIDPTFINLLNSNQTKLKFEDECVSFFEKLGYPFKINKSSLKCIAPHSWPPLLGAISWLVELLTFAESFDDDDNDNNNNNNNNNDDDSNGDIKMKGDQDDDIMADSEEEKSAKSDRAFFNLVADNYGLWLKGKDDDETITKRLMDVYTSKIEGLQEDIESFKKANEQLVTEKARIEKECPKISDLQDQRQNTIEALNEVKRVIRQRDEYIATVKKKHHEWDNKVNEKIAKINDSEEKIAELKHILSKQTISPKDVEIMNREATQLNTKKDELQLQKEEIQRKQYDITENINNILKKLYGLINEYNDLAQKIELIPITAKYSFQQDHTLKLRDDINNRDIQINKATDFVNRDIEFLGNNLQQLSSHYHDKLRKAETQIDTENRKILQLKADLKIKNEEVEILNDRLSRFQGLCCEEKSKMSQLTANAARSIEKIELEMNKQANDIETQLKNKQKEYIKVKNEYNKLFENCKKIEIQLTSKLGIAIQKLIKHRQNVREQLKFVTKKLEDSLEKVTFYHIQEPTIHINDSNININDNDDDDDVEMQ